MIVNNHVFLFFNYGKEVYHFNLNNTIELKDLENFLKAAFIQQISDGKMLVKEDVHELLDSPQEESINWRRILE